MINSKIKCNQILIVDYGMGNITSIVNVLKLLRVNFKISSDYKEIERANSIILPGVGAFGAAIGNLYKLELHEAIKIRVIEKKAYILGICLGMQLLGTESFELGHHKGLNLLKGTVMKIDETKGFSVPHVGWNEVHFLKRSPLSFKIPNQADFYFDHSYQFLCDPDLVVARTKLNEDSSINAIVQQENVLGCQFHPEKSHTHGIQLFTNILRLAGVIEVG